jgi:hypothetical protein
MAARINTVAPGARGVSRVCPLALDEDIDVAAA